MEDPAESTPASQDPLPTSLCTVDNPHPEHAVSMVKALAEEVHQMPDYNSALRGPLASVCASAAPLPCVASLLQCSQQTVRNALASGDKKALRATAKGYKLHRLSTQVYDTMTTFLDIETLQETWQSRKPVVFCPLPWRQRGRPRGGWSSGGSLIALRAKACA